MAVFFACKLCGEEHEASITFMSKEAFDSTPIRYEIQRCPKTGKTASYDKRDMVWHEERLKRRGA